jgi:hypothetical protein
MKHYETPRGKDITVFPIGNAWKVQFDQGGELPNDLSGLFTSEGIAAQAVEMYLERITKKPREYATS